MYGYKENRFLELGSLCMFSVATGVAYTIEVPQCCQIVASICKISEGYAWLAKLCESVVT